MTISMKHLLLLLPLLAVFFISCTANDSAAQPVYDTENHELTSQESYYVLPAEQGTADAGTGDGLKMIGTYRPCNSFVGQEPGELGDPVRFLPLNESYSEEKVLASTNVKVGFHVITPCIEGMYWHIDGGAGIGGAPRGSVAVGKNEGESWPIPLPPAFAFRIERHDDGGPTKGYKLVSCADKAGPCRDLGLYSSKGKTWLAVSNSPFVVVFKKKSRHVFA
ncbi:hypothetical protein U9M48_037370 [Paspalum notatum var. saurae]|uniref:Uncharacterized protein n=1 Tax=Paspalum notatum var. saurae TaxID=547442 RepID=A0AAQ3XAJ9_PASNO